MKFHLKMRAERGFLAGMRKAEERVVFGLTPVMTSTAAARAVLVADRNIVLAATVAMVKGLWRV